MKNITFKDLSVGDTFINSRGNKTTVIWIHKNKLELISEHGTEWLVSKSEFNNRVAQGCYTNFKLQRPILDNVHHLDEFLL